MFSHQRGPVKCDSLPMVWLVVVLLSNLNWSSSFSLYTLASKLRFGHKSISVLAVKLHSSSSSIDTNIDAPDSSNVLFRSPLFGDLRRIRLSDDDEEDTFLEKLGVPVFSASINTENNCADIVVDLVTDPSLKKKKKRRGLEGVINHGPAFIVDNILTSKACEQIISDCEKMNFGSFASGKNLHSAMQIVVEPYMAEAIAKQLAPHIDVNELETLRREMILKGKFDDNDYEFDDTRLFFVGLNRRWRIYRYDSSGNETFAPHIDAGFPPSGVTEDGNSLVWDDSSTLRNDKEEEVVSRLTVLMYLNDDFVGGETKFFSPQEMQGQRRPLSSHIAAVRPVAGSVLLFPQGVGEDGVEYARKFWPTHEGSPVFSGRPKYVIRSDVLFATHREKPPFDDDDVKMFQYEINVRDAFIPKSTVWDSKFLSHVGLLYSPYMGVENLGPFLYSFIRMTKKRRIVEIGAGFTTLWILQALKDNDIELQTIRSIQQDGQCKLLNIDWTIHSAVEDFDSEPSQLLCIDNCEHQKETASGARAVAIALGLDSYLEFQRGDAFSLNLEKQSVDVLWCDFGVGARMSEFISSAWDCIRPGGFLLCHSTLTNENTRLWLEAIRCRQPKEITGIEPGEYVEVSLLENHKRFQNSVSIIQKRKCTDGDIYEEPIYSQYA